MSSPPSASLPPRNVEYSSAAPSALTSEMNASETPFNVFCTASAVTGKSDALEVPMIHTLPLTSGATADAPAPPACPPRRVDQISVVAVGFSLAMNASPPAGDVSNAPGVVGKLSEAVPPET